MPFSQGADPLEVVKFRGHLAPSGISLLFPAVCICLDLTRCYPCEVVLVPSRGQPHDFLEILPDTVSLF